MFPGPALQQANIPLARPFNGCASLRDRIKAYSVAEDDADQQAPDPEESVYQSPSDAFFGWPNSLATLFNTQQDSVAHLQKRRQAQKEFEKPKASQVLQKHRPMLSELQAAESPIARTLIDNVTANRDALYEGAIDKLVTAKRDLEQTFAVVIAEDDRFFDLLDTSHKKIAKPLSETRIHDHSLDTQIHIGERVVGFSELVDTLEAEIASLWDQWKAAQNDVDRIFSELASEQTGIEGGQSESMVAVRESLAHEMRNFEEELGCILKEAHEEVRASEKDFGKKMRGIMSTLLQQYFLE